MYLVVGQFCWPLVDHFCWPLTAMAAKGIVLQFATANCNNSINAFSEVYGLSPDKNFMFGRDLQHFLDPEKMLGLSMKSSPRCCEFS